MTRFFAATALILFAAATAAAEDRREDTSKLTLMTFNVEFMWDGLAPEEGNERIQFPHRGNPTLAAAKMAKLAEIIRRHDPDIVSLQEVENLQSLELLNQTFLADMGYVAYLQRRPRRLHRAGRGDPHPHRCGRTPVA